MGTEGYRMYADEPIYKRIPWWAWVLGAGVLLLVLGRRRTRRGAEFEDYLS
ncbi:MAG: hypothetical protein H6733_01180 [Alphaproteobacteria bacterium]|nr:hypothetical protein [Alphaproteobacteria bacterium]